MQLRFSGPSERFFAMEFNIRTNNRTYDLEAHVRFVGNDLLIAIWGGETPHIGAVAVAQPRPSLKNSRVTSSTASVFCFLGHKEDEIAKSTAELMAASLNCNVVVTAGMHWDDISQASIVMVNQNSTHLMEMILAKIKQLRERLEG